MRHLRRRRSERLERGAAAVEFALVLPILLWLVFGIIDYGIWFADGITARDAARSATRSAALGSVGANTACRPWDSGWQNASSFDKATVCAALGSMQLLGSHVYVKLLYTDGTAPLAHGQVPARGDVAKMCIAMQQSVTMPLIPLPGGGLQFTKAASPIDQPTLDAAGDGGNDATNLPTGLQWSSWCD